MRQLSQCQDIETVPRSYSPAHTHAMCIQYVKSIFLITRVFYDNITIRRYGSIAGRVSFPG